MDLNSLTKKELIEKYNELRNELKSEKIKNDSFNTNKVEEINSEEISIAFYQTDKNVYIDILKYDPELGKAIIQTRKEFDIANGHLAEMEFIQIVETKLFK